MTIAELLKSYRLAAGKTQKAWIGDIVSPSFYSKIEKNTTRISASDLIEILNYNQVNLADFFSQVTNQEKNVSLTVKELNDRIISAYYHNNLSQLKKIKHELASTLLVKQEKIALILDACIALISGSDTQFTEEEKMASKSLFFSTENFDQNSLIIFCNFMYFYDFDSNLVITKKIIKQFQNSSNIEIQYLLLAILSNMITMCIENHVYHQAKELLIMAQKIPTQPETCFLRIAILILENLINYHDDPQQIFLDNCQKEIEQLSMLGMTESSRDWQKFVAQYHD
ncbi:helix-turn-helix domain-containing protein [Lactobacillus sp. ESL0228]|uniref:helix-turn-helix domain-containing protein n=1 Tax=Lactobacillus sp. ESL0228 TaxID=2069352 RepID=UPI000EFA743E|nr:Rgg/GadR/MutR family transcriptional regulator [Lactobacillus sp. ESL0228]RMC47312.1 Rgg/GadR/MutR family transcriptional regulator [Lactobacillus sp. ESL0228]